MKKKYINPQLHIICVRQQQQMLTTSNEQILIGDDGNAESAETRRHSFSVWDDDEEE